MLGIGSSNDPFSQQPSVATDSPACLVFSPFPSLCRECERCSASWPVSADMPGNHSLCPHRHVVPSLQDLVRSRAIGIVITPDMKAKASRTVIWFSIYGAADEPKPARRPPPSRSVRYIAFRCARTPSTPPPFHIARLVPVASICTNVSWTVTPYLALRSALLS